MLALASVSVGTDRASVAILFAPDRGVDFRQVWLCLWAASCTCVPSQPHSMRSAHVSGAS
jgi:hypothetical protein